MAAYANFPRTQSAASFAGTVASSPGGGDGAFNGWFSMMVRNDSNELLTFLESETLCQLVTHSKALTGCLRIDPDVVRG